MNKQQTFFYVIQHDQGCTDEVDSWSTKSEARARIREIEADIEANPQWYRHLANPCYSIEKRTIPVEEPFYSPCQNWGAFHY